MINGEQPKRAISRRYVLEKEDFLTRRCPPIICSLKQRCFSKYRYGVYLVHLSTESLVTALDSQFTYTEPARNEPDRQNGPVVSSAMEDCNELLELAAQGGIQFVRATEDGRYEVMNHSSSISKIFQILSYIYIYFYV